MTRIESVIQESRRFEPPDVLDATIAGRSAYEALVDEARDDWEGFWRRHADAELDWISPFSRVFSGANITDPRWFEDGTLNVSFNCLDRHLETRRKKPAILFEADGGEVEIYTYEDLHTSVCRLANAMKREGVKRGDRVILYMPMHPQAVVCMQACARIGAIHSVVFGGFSAKALADRIEDTGACLVFTADEGVRGGKKVPLKAMVDKALDVCAEKHSVQKVVVMQRTGEDVFMQEGRDLSLDDFQSGCDEYCPVEEMRAEDPLFILYTSGSTGKPKGMVHTSAGYLLSSILTMKWTFDHKEEAIFWCTADVGWITGHSYVAYGPLAVGGTQVMFEGVPTYPHAGRFWEMIERHRVTTFYTAPTAIRALIKAGADLPDNYDLSSLRILGTVGEPINPDAWAWYRERVGGGRCPVVDTWWQTETGAHMIAPLPGAIATKPGSCTLPLPGIFASIVDEWGDEVGPNEDGFLVVKRSWPSQARSIWGDHERYLRTYFQKNASGTYDYAAGDSAFRDDDGYFWILGRMDDVLNVSGHRLGTMELESALVTHANVTEAAVVARPDDITGEAIVAFVVTHGETPEGRDADLLSKELKGWITEQVGPIARPSEIRFGDNLPKTRSGKIMRRLLRSIAQGEEIVQDTSTLENPGVLDQLKHSR